MSWHRHILGGKATGMIGTPRFERRTVGNGLRVGRGQGVDQSKELRFFD